MVYVHIGASKVTRATCMEIEIEELCVDTRERSLILEIDQTKTCSEY